MLGCWQGKEVPGQDDVPLSPRYAATCILLGQRPEKQRGHVGGTAAAEICTLAERGAEGAEK